VLYLSPGRGILEAAARVEPDLVILDLPSTPAGWELLHRLCVWSDVPLILLVADERVDDRIEGLDRGADDSLGRSFNPAELRARVRAVLRRSRKAARALGPLWVGELWLDPVRGEAYVRGAPLDLRPHEFGVLLVLARNPGVVFSRQRLLLVTRGSRARAARPGSLDVYASRVRRKLTGSGVAIQTVRGVGYKLVAEARPG
jgi:DNA-binding response OmpR family regulator